MSNVLSPSSSRPIHADWLTRLGMTPVSTYATFQSTSLLASGLQKTRSLVPANVNIRASDTTQHPVRRKSVITPFVSPCSPRPLPTSDQHAFLRFLRKLLSSSPGIHAVRTDEPRNPLDFPATSPLPRPLIKPDGNSRSPTTQSSVVNTFPTIKSSIHRLSTWSPFETKHASPAINVIDVPLAPGKLRYATAGAPGPDDDLIRDEDYVSPPPSPNPDSRRPSTAKVINAGEHGSGRFCFCL
ncbi:hypothetical protein F4604DRAFT_1951505 [Suillus subluteus]|nr:hypothetical protein F4604DRAFT_1951505 [Suillus subluteus]